MRKKRRTKRRKQVNVTRLWGGREVSYGLCKDLVRISLAALSALMYPHVYYTYRTRTQKESSLSEVSDDSSCL